MTTNGIPYTFDAKMMEDFEKALNLTRLYNQTFNLGKSNVRK